MAEIGVAFGFIVVIAAIAVVLVGVVMLFIISIKNDFGQRTPPGYVDSGVPEPFDRAG